MIKIEYVVEDAVWALGTISDKFQKFSFNISYLHDSLLELTQSAIIIGKNSEAKVSFFDEPGETILLLKKLDKENISYEVRIYEDLISWGKGRK